MMSPDLTISDDYAELESAGYTFHYGYEFAPLDNKWGFMATAPNDARAWRISYERMAKYRDCPDQFACAECLLFGIGLFLSRKPATPTPTPPHAPEERP